MPAIRPSSDLRNKYNEISKFCHTYHEPVFITKNGAGDLVVMSNDEYERLCGKQALHELLDEGLAAMKRKDTAPAEDVFAAMDSRLELSGNAE